MKEAGIKKKICYLSYILLFISKWGPAGSTWNHEQEEDGEEHETIYIKRSVATRDRVEIL
eukprot:scaffold26631_cov139-Skeletonema_menzelii.AAC.20